MVISEHASLRFEDLFEESLGLVRAALFVVDQRQVVLGTEHCLGVGAVYQLVAFEGFAILGEDHPYTLTSMRETARSLAALGHTEDARTLFESALSAQRRRLGEDHPETAHTAELLRDLGTND